MIQIDFASIHKIRFQFVCALLPYSNVLPLDYLRQSSPCLHHQSPFFFLLFFIINQFFFTKEGPTLPTEPLVPFFSTDTGVIIMRKFPRILILRVSLRRIRTSLHAGPLLRFHAFDF